MPSKLSIGGYTIQPVGQAKYLGAIFDCNLTWRPQLDTVVKKVSRKIGILRRIGRNLNTSDSLRLFVQPCSLTLTTAHRCGALGQTLLLTASLDLKRGQFVL